MTYLTVFSRIYCCVQ